MEQKLGQRHTYAALTDSTFLIILCFDAGEGYNRWAAKDLQTLTGTFTHSRYVLCMLCFPPHCCWFHCVAHCYPDNMASGECWCRPYRMNLEELLIQRRAGSDLVPGMQCLVRAFAPELAGKTLDQVRSDAIVCAKRLGMAKASLS